MAEITVDPDDLATVTIIARALKVGRSTVSMWDHRRTTSGFPAPVIDIPQARLFSIKEVAAWLASQ